MSTTTQRAENTGAEQSGADQGIRQGRALAGNQSVERTAEPAMPSITVAPWEAIQLKLPGEIAVEIRRTFSRMVQHAESGLVTPRDEIERLEAKLLDIPGFGSTTAELANGDLTVAEVIESAALELLSDHCELRAEIIDLALGLQQGASSGPHGESETMLFELDLPGADAFCDTFPGGLGGRYGSATTRIRPPQLSAAKKEGAGKGKEKDILAGRSALPPEDAEWYREGSSAAGQAIHRSHVSRGQRHREDEDFAGVGLGLGEWQDERGGEG